MPPPSPPQAGFPAMPPRKPGLGHPPPPIGPGSLRPPPGLQNYHRFTTISDLLRDGNVFDDIQRIHLRLMPSPHFSVPLTWQRASIAEESDDTSILGQRVTTFCQAGGNIIDSKLRMGELQNKQIACLMDELKAFKRDAQFEWCWAEISLHKDVGEKQFLSQVHSAKATTIHLIAKRRFKVSYNPIQVYRELMNERPRLPSQGYASTRDKTTAAAATQARTADATPASDACHLRPQTLL
ncbi:hypothetical protein WAI453_009178 [Rhynchosporium graminicola]